MGAYQYPDILFQFFAGYFGQDWPSDSDTWQSSLAVLQKEWPTDEQVRLARELKELLNTETDETELERKAEAYGCAYLTSADGHTMRQWLGKVVQVLEAN